VGSDMRIRDRPGIYAVGDYDLAVCIIGKVAREKIVDGRAVRVGDLLLGLPSAGLHANGYSLARLAFDLDGPPDEVRERLTTIPPGCAESLGALLLAEHRSYAAELLPAIDAGRIHALAHITGGGLVDNVPRVLPAHLAAHLDAGRWETPPLFTAIQDAAHVTDAEMYRVFNMGIGFVVIVGRYYAESIQRQLLEDRVPTFVIGEVRAGEPGVEFVV